MPRHYICVKLFFLVQDWELEDRKSLSDDQTSLVKTASKGVIIAVKFANSGRVGFNFIKRVLREKWFWERILKTRKFHFVVLY